MYTYKFRYHKIKAYVANLNPKRLAECVHALEWSVTLTLAFSLFDRSPIAAKSISSDRWN